MPLRFSGSAPREAAVLAVDLPPRAEQLLAAGQLAGYRELFGKLDAVEDPHRRYWAANAMLECGFAAGRGCGRSELIELFATLAGCALGVLEREPREPRLLNYAGVLMYELWSLDAAEALFGAARRLDRQLPDVQRNLAEARARKRLVRSARRPVPLHRELPALARAALRVADSARPVEGLKLSLCMIVRDEQEMLPRCLQTVADAVDEIVVVDTGSRDSTMEIARSFGARVIEHPWSGSFAEARNVSFDAASGDWVMYLDADEVLVREDAPLLRSLTGRTWREAFYLSETNYTGDLEAGTAVTHNALRVFRNRPEYRFEGRLHEQIANRLPGYLPERLEATAVRVQHYGYLGVVRDGRDKSARNIELLLMQQKEGPPSPFLHYNLGSEHAAAGEHAAALAEFERAWALLESLPDRDSYEFVPALVSRLVKALRACGRPAEAIARAEDGLARFPGFTDLVLEQAHAAVALGELERAEALLRRCIAMGDAPREYTSTVGCGTHLPRINLAELLAARGRHADAVALLEEALRERPEFAGAVMPLTVSMLALGAQPPALVESVQRLLGGEPAPAARFLLGTALYEAGAAAEGELQFRAVLERQPGSGRARVALAEALLAQRRYLDAAAVAAELAPEDALAPAAARSELFGLLAAGEPAQARQALARARGAGLPQEEAAMFEGWIRLREGASPTGALPAEALGLLETVLEALVRVQDFEGFEALLPLLEAAPISPRERRELLAQLYLRRGYLASAAEEWMAVCGTSPDARALLGLARVAAAGGMQGEAAEFAAAALEHDPGNEHAAALLARSAQATPG